MSRSIEIGGNVEISSVGFIPTTYVIRLIHPDGIYISTQDNPETYSLTVSDGKGGWIISGSD